MTAHVRATDGDAISPLFARPLPAAKIIEFQFPTLLASPRTGGTRTFHANMVFIESLLDDSIYHKGMDSAKWKFSVFNKA